MRSATKSKVYQVLFQIARHCYQVMQPYLPNIVEISRSHLQQTDGQICYPLELWQNIAETYLDQARSNSSPQLENYMALAQWTLLPQLLHYFSATQTHS